MIVLVMVSLGSLTPTLGAVSKNEPSFDFTFVQLRSSSLTLINNHILSSEQSRLFTTLRLTNSERS